MGGIGEVQKVWDGDAEDTMSGMGIKYNAAPSMEGWARHGL